MSRLLVLALAACTLTAACKKGDSAAAEKAGGRTRGGNNAVFPVDVIPVEKKLVEYLVSGPGAVDAFEHVQVTSRVAGVVDKVAFKEGQQVKKGDVLVVIDGQRFQLAVNTAKAQLDKSKAAEADNDAMVQRREGASDKFPGLITGEELSTYQTKALTAKADTAVSVENLRTAQLNLSDASVRAPMEGVIQTRTVQTGQYVNAGTVMATLLRNDPMLLRFSVTPQDAPRIRPDMVVDFKIRESQDTFHGTVTLVAGAADDESHMVAVTATVNDEGHKYWLRPGLFADVTVRLGARRNAPLIPRTAIRANERGQMVYVINDSAAAISVDGGAPVDGAIPPMPAPSGSHRGGGGGGKGGAHAPGSAAPAGSGAPTGPMQYAHEVPVTLGMSTKDGWVEVRSGLVGGERLVVRGGESLMEGAKVKASVVSMPAPDPAAPIPDPKLPEGMPSARPDPIPRTPPVEGAK